MTTAPPEKEKARHTSLAPVLWPSSTPPPRSFDARPLPVCVRVCACGTTPKGQSGLCSYWWPCPRCAGRL